MIAYLLHEMPEDYRAEFSEDWMADAALHEELRRVEAELIDEYVRGDGAPERRSRIESFLLSEDGQEKKLEFARALHQELAPPRHGSVSFPPARGSRAWLGAAAAIVILAGASAWLALENRALDKRVGELTAASKLQMGPPAGMPAGSVFETTLPLDSLRGTNRDTAIALPRGASVVRLDLELESGDESADTSAEVTASGTAIWREWPVREERRGGVLVASIWIPVALLAPGNYEIRLSAAGKALANYRMYVPTRPAGGP
jgi:hypothetical protein